MGGAQVSKHRNEYICTCTHPDFSQFKNNTIKWMADIDDEKYISDITIPGTHQSLARQGGYAKVITVAQCQSWSVLDQLNAGIRCLDIRGKCKKGKFLGYHGIVDQKFNVADTFPVIYAFLNQFPSEFVIVIIKEEDRKTTHPEITKTFEAMIPEEDRKKYWFMENRIPQLKEIRGKIFFVPRWKYDNGYVYGNIIEQDRYNVKVPEKAKKVEEFRQFSLKNTGRMTTGKSFFMNYLSGATVKDWPLTYAAKTNKLFYNNSNSRGIIMIDFPGEKLIDNIISVNYNKEQNIDDNNNKHLQQQVPKVN